ncbi:MAG: DUF5995 family protein [Solirubrobacteraceae bacterium]
MNGLSREGLATPTHEMDIARVIERMTAIAAGLAPDDGVARFNDLYLTVTRAVAQEAVDDAFEDPHFLSLLDVVFAGRYFAAIDDSLQGRPVSRAWVPLFEERARPRVAPIQFALAGMNAHINYDLCLALVESCAQMGLAPDSDSAQHRDYLRVNGIIERVQGQVQERFATGLLSVADEALGRLDDILAMWKVARARDSAWTHAQALWALRDLPSLRTDYLAALGGLVGLVGRGLLTPTL